MAKRRKAVKSHVGHSHKINPKALGLSFGIIWAACLLLCTIVSIFTGYASGALLMIGTFYLGFKLTWTGAIIGAIWGFVDGFVGGWLIAWLYNKLI